MDHFATFRRCSCEGTHHLATLMVFWHKRTCFLKDISILLSEPDKLIETLQKPENPCKLLESSHIKEKPAEICKITTKQRLNLGEASLASHAWRQTHPFAQNKMD